MTRFKLLTFLLLAMGGGVIFYTLLGRSLGENKKKDGYKIIDRWELPKVLKEVSGIAWLGSDQLLALQDEEGILFVYDLKMEEIVKRIPFGDDGDYEGLAVHGNDAYVLRNDGTLFQISDFRSPERIVDIYETDFKKRNNMESLTWDDKGNRLLLIPKDYDFDTDRVKGIYAFSIEEKKLSPEPIYRIDMKDKALKDFRKKDDNETFRPSDLAVHPVDGEIYVLDGANPKMVVLNTDGDLIEVIDFKKKDFPQPEGLTFSPDGKLFISNEQKKGQKANILQVKIMP